MSSGTEAHAPSAPLTGHLPSEAGEENERRGAIAGCGARSASPIHSQRALPVSASTRQHTRNSLPAMPPVDAEITVGGQQHRIVQRLRHADKAGIRETHRHVGIFLQEPEYGVHVVGETKAADESAAVKQ